MPRILIISNNPGIQTSLKKLLTQQNFMVSIADQHCEGLKMAKAMRPNIILFDLATNHNNNFAAIKALKISSRTCNIPVVFLFEKSEQITFNPARFSTSDMWASKPLNPDRILHTIKMLV